MDFLNLCISLELLMELHKGQLKKLFRRMFMGYLKAYLFSRDI
jgi:hypothetical protein